jgi:hypothetical protein
MNNSGNIYEIVALFIYNSFVYQLQAKFDTNIIYVQKWPNISNKTLEGQFSPNYNI